MAVDATLMFFMTTQETPPGVDGVSSPILIHDAYDERFRLHAGSTVPITAIIEKLITLTAGAYTLDLTNFLGLNGAVIDGTGKKVRAIRIKPLGANNVVLAEGASTGYALLPTAKTIYTGGIWQEYFADAAPVISGADKALDFTGSGSQTFELTILLG